MLEEELTRHYLTKALRLMGIQLDYSSLAALELLSRQSTGTLTPAPGSKVLLINGGLFADAHSQPLDDADA